MFHNEVILQNKGNDFIEKLLDATDLVKLVSEYVPLEKKGADYWGCCPFHHEKTPSFLVSGFKQLYYCHGACHEGGNAITFIKKIESVESADAVKILAKRAGMEIPQNERFERDDAEIIKKKERLYRLMREAARRYHENLSKPAAAHVREYLKNRGVGEKMATKFGLGYATNGTEMVAHLSEMGYTLQEMKDAGITATSEKGTYDVFYERLIVPIVNQLGEVVAFGGRTLQKNPDFAKYRNSAQTLVFDKGKTVFAVNLLQKRKQKKLAVDYVILCEGYMDVIALHAAGFDTAVASMGTSLTFSQAKQLKNFGGRVFVSFDGDAAGQKATLRSLDILEEAGLSVRVVQLPEGLDPDDVVRKMGAPAYQSLLDAAVTLPAFKIETLKKQFDLGEPEGKARFAVEAAKVVKSLKNPVEQEEYLKTIQAATGYSMDALRRQTEIAEPAPMRPAEPQPPENAPSLKKEEAAKKFVLASIAAEKAYVDFSAAFDEFLSDTFSREAALFFIANRKDKTDSIAGLYYRMGEGAVKELNEIIHYPFIEGDNAEKYKNCVRSLREAALKKEKEGLARAYLSPGEAQNKKSILYKLSEIDEKLKQLKNSEGAE